MRFKSLSFPALLPLFLLALPVAAEAAPAAPAAASAAPGAPAAEPRPALWLLADEDTRIYMFGTVHVLPPGFRWRSAALDKAVGEAAELVVETYEAPGSESEADLAGFFADTPQPPLLERVPPRQRKPLKRAVKASGMPMTMFDSMHSWAAAMTLGIAQTLSGYGVDDIAQAPGVEDVLEEAFRTAGKPILSVEDANAVVAAMSALPEEEQRKMLLEAIGAVPAAAGGEDALAADEQEWVAGHADALDLAGADGFPPAIFDVLVRRRNAAWTNWLEERLKKPGTLLFAVGAGHLAGKESVQAMLAARGLKVERVD